MAKKINFSIKNDDLKDIEKISKSSGKKVIKIIRERYELGKKNEDFIKKIDKLRKKIENIQRENEERIIKIYSLFEVVVRQNVFSNEILKLVLKSNKKDEELIQYETKIELKSDEKINKIRRIYYEEIDKNES